MLFHQIILINFIKFNNKLILKLKKMGNKIRNPKLFFYSRIKERENPKLKNTRKDPSISFQIHHSYWDSALIYKILI
jgi:hypothetical protein